MVTYDIIILCLAAFGAGFVDSIVGGGGLVQLPAMMMVLPQVPLVNLLGTNKLVSIAGTSFSAWRFSRQIPFVKSILIPAMIVAFISSTLGALAVSFVSNDFLKPFFMVMMFIIFIFTLKNKSFGLLDHDPNIVIPVWKPLMIGLVMGFYDGFFGPGTGSFLIIGFVGLMGMTFVQGSAYAKMINVTTNAAAVLFFIMKGTMLYHIALPMMAFNILGAVLGVKMALLKGNEFVRTLLRIIVFSTIAKLAYQVADQYFF